MTVAPTSTVTTYALAGGAVGPFATVWPFVSVDDVAVYLYDEVTGDLTRLSADIDYSVVAVSPLIGGGQVFLTAPHNGLTLRLSRESSTGQPSDFGDATGFSPQSLEDALDNLARQIQELWSRPSGSGGGGGSVTLTFALIVAALGYVPENFAHRGVANGYAPLGADGKVPSGFLPAGGGGGAADTITGDTTWEGIDSYPDNATALAALGPNKSYRNGDVLQITHA